jgi:hypothetical protein
VHVTLSLIKTVIYNEIHMFGIFIEPKVYVIVHKLFSVFVEPFNQLCKLAYYSSDKSVILFRATVRFL